MRKLKLEELNRIDEKAFKSSKKAPIVLMLDNIRSGHNVGSAFRIGDAFRVQEILLCGFSPLPPHREILKTALGADETVAWRSGDSIKLIKEFKNAGFKIYAVEQTDQIIFLQELNASDEEKILLVFGNEVKGVSDELLPLVDGCIEIPQHGTKHSLNVSVSIGIVLWELCRKRSYEIPE